MKFFSYLLLPFALIYQFVAWIRNKLYDLNILKSYSFDIPIIGIGNLSTGGTGKTPMAEYVLELLLKSGYKPALLSRGYMRNTKGFQMVTENSSAAEAGDEPVQIKNKFPGVYVAVCESRVEGVKKIKEAAPEVNVIVLDDSFQHRKLRAGFYILLTDYHKPYYNDLVLPAGRLREGMAGRKRADVIVMTKAPAIGKDEKLKLKRKLKPYKGQEVFFTGINYEKLRGIHLPLINVIDPEQLGNFQVLLFAGIANPQTLNDFIEARAKETTHLFFPDHHNFRKADIEKIRARWQELKGEKKIIITTEKDWHRLKSSPLATEVSSLPLYVLPMQNMWNMAEKAIFDEKILSYVRSDQKVG